MTIFLLFFISFYGYVFWILFDNFNFRKQREKIQWRVHINGIRGKSTVTRYATAVFREAGYPTDQLANAFRHWELVLLL